MYSGVEYVRDVCKEKGIAISKLEKDLGFSNGYLNPKKLKKIPLEKAIAISDYLKCDIEPLLQMENKVIKVQLPDYEKTIQGLFQDIESYYHFKETQRIAQEIFDDKDLHALFDAAQGSRPEDLKMARDFLKRLKETNPDA